MRLPWTLLALALLGASVAAAALGQPGVALLAGAVAIGALVGALRSRPAGRPDVTTPVALPPEETELEEGPVWACMRCGDPRVRPAALSEGGIPGGGAGATWICPRCRHRGPPLEFDSPTSYRQFVKGLHADQADSDVASP